MAATSYNVLGVVYDSDSEPADYNGRSYDHYLTSLFSDEKFKEEYLARYIGKGPNMENLLLLVPSVSQKVVENYEDALRYVIKALDQHLNTKYSLLICQTCVSWTESNSYYFVNQWYNMLPKSKKKNLSKVYLIHSPMSTKTLLTLSTPFMSSKSSAKVELVENISDAFHKLELNKKNMLRYFPYVVQRTEELKLGITRPLSPFGTELWVLSARLGQRFKDFKYIPRFLSNILEKLESPEVVKTPNLLNLQCDAPTLYDVVTKVENVGENYTFKTPEETVSVFKLVLDTQQCGLLGPKAMVAVKEEAVGRKSPEEVVQDMKELTKTMKTEQRDCVYCVVKTLRVIARNSKENGMSLKMVSKIMAPSFFRPAVPDPYIYTVVPKCEKLVCTIIEQPSLFFEVEKDKERSTRLVKTEEHERKKKEHREKDEDKHAEKTDKHGTKHRSKDSGKSDKSRESSKSERSDKSGRDDSRQRDEHKDHSTKVVVEKSLSPRNEVQASGDQSV